MAPNSPESSHKGKAWPEYFIVRTTGEVVPLIAVDELPVGIDIIGVPRSLGLEETVGMLNLGVSRSTSWHYELVSSQETKKENGNVNFNCKTKVEPSSTAATPKPALTVPTTTPTTTPPTSPKATGTVSARLAPPDSSILCRHWCQHGICKWGQQCRYRHEMPMTLQGLQEVNLSDWPTWYRKLNPGYFANEVQTRSNRSRMHACGAGAGHGGTCCGSLHGGRPERRSVRGPRERDVRRASKGELGEQIVARLRNMAKEASAAEKANAMIEKAAVRVTRNWEDESEGSDAETAVQPVEEAKGKLVDV